ncbi:MAG TPA: hypothetical protein VFH88_14285 [Candidatus Krumholzibacteria bacterium]|nr:hypothetical protein [Candidatus Krumholzibacteria bacterium]
MNTRWKQLAAATVIAVTAVLIAGCSSDQPTSTSAATTGADASLIPTYAEISAAVTLNDAGAAAVKSALADWKQAQAAATQDAPFRYRQREMKFIADVAPALDNNQLEKLVALLVARREARREEMQTRMRGRNGNGDFMKGLAEQLGLTKQQQTALMEMHQQARAKQKEQFDAFKAGTITREQLHTQLQQIRDANHQQMAKILTADQLAKMDALREQRQDRRLDRRMDRVGDHVDQHAAWLNAVLGLSDAQLAQVTAALNTFADAQKAAMEALKANTITRDQFHTQMTTAHDTLEKAITDILTADQQTRLDIVRPLLPHGPRYGA